MTTTVRDILAIKGSEVQAIHPEATVYEAAVRHPGVVVMHESNLHHLMADLTIKRGD